MNDFEAEHPRHGQGLTVPGAIDSDGHLEFRIGAGCSYCIDEPTAYLDNEQVRALVLHLQRLLGDAEMERPPAPSRVLVTVQTPEAPSLAQQVVIESAVRRQVTIEYVNVLNGVMVPVHLPLTITAQVIS